MIDNRENPDAKIASIMHKNNIVLFAMTSDGGRFWMHGQNKDLSDAVYEVINGKAIITRREPNLVYDHNTKND